MLEPDSLQAFVAVAEEGHFVRAADALGCAQSVVSKRLKRLEDRIGVRLVARSKRSKVELTQAGQQFLPTAREILAQLAKAEARGRRIAGGQAGVIRIGYVFSAIMTGVLPGLIRVLRAKAPELEIVPVAMETPEQIAAIADERIDVAIIRSRPGYPAGITARVVHREGVRLALAADNALARQESIACADLAEARFIVPQFLEEVGLIDVINRIVRTGRLPPPEITRTKDFITAAGLAAAGMGVAAVPASLTALQLAGLLYRPISDLDAAMELVLLCRDDLPPVIADTLAQAPPGPIPPPPEAG